MNSTEKSFQNNEKSQEFGIFYGETLFTNLSNKEPLIEHFLYKNDVICISAESGVGKSILALQLMASLTSGRPFLDSFKVIQPCQVLYFQTEGDRVETVERVITMSKGISFKHDNWVHLNLDGISLNTQEGCNIFIDLIQKPQKQYDVLIIDPLYTTVKGSMGSDEVATDWIRNIRKVKGIYNCAIILIHHESIKPLYVGNEIITKSIRNIFGSTFWGAFVNYNYKLSVNKSNIYTLESGKERTHDTIDKIEMRLVEPEPLMYVLADEEMSIKEIQIIKLLTETKKPLSIKTFINIGISRAQTYRILGKLLNEGKVTKIKSGSSIMYQAQEIIKKD